MSVLPKSCISATVRFHCPPDQYLESLSLATAAFSTFGDIARIDTTLATSTGCILVTFFDIRVAQKVVAESNGSAEFSPPAQHDFRAVSFAASIYSELPGGFSTSGDISGLSICGEDVVIEFYDMRAAQQVVLSVPGSKPRPPPPLIDTRGSAPMSHGRRATAKIEYGMEMPPVGLSTPMSRGKKAAANIEHGMEMPPVGPPVPPKVPGPGPQRSLSTKGSSSDGTAEMPQREKLSGKDLSKFDISPEKIRNGQDARTTVMVRNIPKTCTRETFVDVLNRCGLEDRYTFFYMPFDKRRDIHCGFAFVNLKAPQDVLTLDEFTTSRAWRSIGTRQNGAPPELSYGRLQGHARLVQHFYPSAVMHDLDERKRPLFLPPAGCEVAQAQAEKAPQLQSVESMPAKVNIDSSPMQPCYVKFSEPSCLTKSSVFPNSFDFLMSNGAGA